MNILLLTSHAIAEYDDLRMFTDLDYNVFSIGGAYDEVPFEGKRPPISSVVRYPDLEELCIQQREWGNEEFGAPGPAIDWAKGIIHPRIIDWADIIIVHHFPERWIGDQWEHIRHKRVIWRTCGQSDPRLERSMAPFHAEGMQIVRYSPAEKRAFQSLGWAGQDALIRFGKYPSDYGPWTGTEAVVGNVTQDLARRGDACGYDRWLSITDGLPTYPAGPGSDEIGGSGSLPYRGMLAYLSQIRTYLYTGTMPASYTLGLIEAMLSGVPVVPSRWPQQSADWQWLYDLWEADDILLNSPYNGAQRQFLEACLNDWSFAHARGEEHRKRAVELFDVAMVGAQWKAFLG